MRKSTELTKIEAGLVVLAIEEFTTAVAQAAARRNARLEPLIAEKQIPLEAHVRVESDEKNTRLVWEEPDPPAPVKRKRKR
jgi:hypothetical protein